jgi:hypothetical protein
MIFYAVAAIVMVVAALLYLLEKSNSYAVHYNRMAIERGRAESKGQSLNVLKRVV